MQCQKSSNIWVVLAAIIIIAALVFMVISPRRENFDMTYAYPCRGRPFCRQRRNCPYDGTPCPYKGANIFPCLGRAECSRRADCPFNN